MNKNRLKKTASILLAGIMSFGVFAFAGPVFNVNAEEEYSFNDIEAWPTVAGKYKVAKIGDVEWCALDGMEIEYFDKALPSIKDVLGDVSHFYIYGPYEDVAITTPLVLAETSVTLDLNGHNLDIQTSEHILELTAGSSYTIINSSSESSSIYSSNGLMQVGGAEGGYFSVSSSSLSINNVTVSDRYAKDKGGAIIANAGSNVNLENVNFQNCESPNGGAVYIANGGTASMKNVSMSSAGTFASKGSSVYCGNGGTLKLSGTISFASTNPNPVVGDLWIESQSKVEIGSTTNSFSVDCADLPDPHYGVLSVSEGGVSSGITSFNKSYELVEQDSYLHFAEVSLTEEVTLKGANAIVNAEVNGTYYPLAFKLTLSAPASFQSSEYSYDVGYTYIKKNGQAATAHNGNVSFTDDEAYLVIGMNPALMTNDITWKVVKDGESVFSGSVTPLDCLKSYIEDDDESTQTIAKDLIVMGVYTEEYLYNTSTLRSEVISQNLISEGDLDLSGVTLPSTGYTKDWNSSEDNLLTYYGCSLVLNEYGLAMRQYVYYGEGQGLTTMYDAIFCTVNGVDYPSILNFTKDTSKSMFYYAPVSNIKLSDLDKTNTFVFKYRIGQGTEFIDSGSIEYSVVDYMNMARNSKSTNTKLMNTLLSMYSLYNSCKATTQA